jgi:hypothetical protein
MVASGSHNAVVPVSACGGKHKALTARPPGCLISSGRFGRWLSADWSNVPVAVPYANLTNPQTLNLYAMVRDNPETFADLDGHCILTASNAGCVDALTTQAEEEAARMAQHPRENPARQQNGSSKGRGFWSHVRNILHGHSWNYDGLRESVTVSGPNPAVTFAADIGGLVAAATKSMPLGFAAAALSVGNDPSDKNKAVNAVGLIPGFDWPMAIMGSFTDFLEYGAYHSQPAGGWRDDYNGWIPTHDDSDGPPPPTPTGPSEGGSMSPLACQITGQC